MIFEPLSEEDVLEDVVVTSVVVCQDELSEDTKDDVETLEKFTEEAFSEDEGLVTSDELISDDGMYDSNGAETSEKL